MTTDDEDEKDEEQFDELPINLNKSIRTVQIPKLKWQANSYHSMINWDEEFRTEPPFITSLSDEELLHIINTPLEVPKWPNNTQAVVRAIKLVSEAVMEVTGNEERDGYIRQRIQSRLLMPKYNTKRDFETNFSV